MKKGKKEMMNTCKMHAGRKTARDEQYPNAHLALELESNQRNGETLSQKSKKKESAVSSQRLEAG